MKDQFKVLKAKPRIEVVMTRDSVCAGDDCMAPHTKKVEIASFIDTEAFVKEISLGYLPTIAGTGHSWTCELNNIKIAEIGHAGIRTLVRECPFLEKNRVHFVYHSARF